MTGFGRAGTEAQRHRRPGRHESCAHANLGEVSFAERTQRYFPKTKSNLTPTHRSPILTLTECLAQRIFPMAPRFAGPSSLSPSPFPSLPHYADRSRYVKTAQSGRSQTGKLGPAGFHPRRRYISHVVKPGLSSQKSPNPFPLLSLHGLYVHICVPNNILFAHRSPATTLTVHTYFYV
jgi:hypothetical protein